MNPLGCDMAGTQQVGIGEVKVGVPHERLKATLGSCVGIALLWKKGGRCGLAHCLLPAAPGPFARLGGRYVDQAVPSLLAMMGIKPADYPDVEVVVAGGARMFSIRTTSANVGKTNTDAAQRCLQQAGLCVTHLEIGGRRGHQIVIDCSDYTYAVTQIARQPEEFQHECT